MPVVAGSLALGPPARALPATTCARYGTIAVQDRLSTYQQDEWNSRETQCALVDDTTGAWTLSQANFDMPVTGPPATYPSIFRGCHWGSCTKGSGLPIRISSLGTATSSWVTTEAPTGAYNVTYDLWTNSTPTTSGAPNGSEIMIWLNSLGGVRPAGQLVGTVAIAGATWKVYKDRRTTWNAISYERTTGTAFVIDLDVRAFILDSVKRGATKPSWYLLDAEAGFEIWQGGEGLASDSFSFSAAPAT